MLQSQELESMMNLPTGPLKVQIRGCSSLKRDLSESHDIGNGEDREHEEIN